MRHGLTSLLSNHYRSSRSEEHTSELQSPCNLVCRLLLEKKKKTQYYTSRSLTSSIQPSLPEGASRYPIRPCPSTPLNTNSKSFIPPPYPNLRNIVALSHV